MKKWISIVFLVLACGYTVNLVIEDFTTVDEMASLTANQQAMDLEELRQELVDTRVRHSRTLRRLSITIQVLYGAALCIWLSVAHRRKVRRDEYYFRIGQNIKEITEVKHAENEKTSRLLRELLTREYAVMDAKCREYYEHSSSANKRGVSREAEEIIDRLSSKEQLQKLEEDVDKYQSGVMSELRRDLPALKEDDYNLFLYSVLGFSSVAVSIFLKTDKIDSVYNRKARLKTKIRQLDEAKQQKYMSYL